MIAGPEGTRREGLRLLTQRERIPRRFRHWQL